MRQVAVVVCLALLAAAADDASDGDDFSVSVCGIAPDATRASAAALASVAALVLRAAGVRAHADLAPDACVAPPQPAECVAAALAALSGGRAHAALVPVRAAAALPAPRLRDAGLEELGDAAPPWRRACLATRPPARSLLDLADQDLAAAYHLSADHLQILSNYQCDSKNCTFTPDLCYEVNSTCATLLTSDETERDTLAAVVAAYGLRARVTALGARLLEAAGALDTPLIVCDRAPELSPLARLRATPLGPPPCRASDACPFEPMRLVKIANVRALTRYPSALRTLVRLTFGAEELVELTVSARREGPEAAAQAYVTAHPSTASIGEVRVAVMLPASTYREAYESRSFLRAAELAERELEAGRLPRAAHFKVEVFDDECSASRAYKYLTGATLSDEYGALSAVAGPACGAAFADVARQSSGHEMPVLAYTPQAPPPPPAAGLALLAAGDARHHSDLYAALLDALRWRRITVLSEAATRAALELTRLNVADVTNSELPDDGDVHVELITQWAKRAADANYRILYPCLEDAREVRMALCAGNAVGLTPAAGAVWLVPSALPTDWLTPTSGDVACSVETLAAMAEGHFRITPAWLAEWPASSRDRWAALCPGCVPRAALLYDTLKLWAASLARLLDKKPAALDYIHHQEHVRTLIEDATSSEYDGLTGPFEWSFTDGVHARSTPLLLQQWRNGSYMTVGRFERDVLELKTDVIRWETSDKRVPDDGGERCGLRPLAEFLKSDCRTAFIVLAALLLSALVGALATLAIYCRRRAEREYRAHLEALQLRTYGLKPGGLDRWEVPRERVVINRKLGTGAFGTVYGGHALLAEDRGWSAVAVKTLKAGATTEEKLDFLSEAEAMKRFDHKNVVRLLAVVTKTEPVCTVMEFMLYGDLKNYLLARRHLATEAGLGGDEAAEEVSPRRLTTMALDAARALSYLAQLRYVHRDVAARNCLVSANRVVKLADFGMTRLVFENDYYRFSRKGMLPVRWMAPESLALGVFSPASDVWSFGVLLYEIVTFGSLPFQGLSNSEVLTRVKAGHTLDLPTGLKPQLEGLIKSCWRQDYKTRPAASEVAAFLADSPRLLTPCLDVPLDCLPLDPDPPWRTARDRAEARWVSWAAPASAATDTTYLSADARPPSEGDAFLPTPPTP